jgi:hypothetical protein
MQILEEQLVQREFDGNWERIAKVMDYENAYSFRNEVGVEVTMIPEKWLTVAVYPFIMEEVAAP